LEEENQDGGDGGDDDGDGDDDDDDGVDVFSIVYFFWLSQRSFSRIPRLVSFQLIWQVAEKAV
jgi:hypothetical protein